MPFFSILRSLFISPRKPYRSRQNASKYVPLTRPMLEILEDRTCPTVLVVTTASDALIHSGMSLRDAIATANLNAAAGVSDTITFDSSLNGATITLTQSQFFFTAGSGTTTIDGGSQIAISGNNASRIFRIESGAHAELIGLTIYDGNEVNGGINGGGILNNGSLAIRDCTIEGNSAQKGGGIFNEGSLTITNSTISANSTSSGYGGGINNGGLLTVSNCIITGNMAEHGYGGGIHTDSGIVTVNDCTITYNSASMGGGIDCWGGTLELRTSSISYNTAGLGGGINCYYLSTSITLSDCTISSNAANIGGGIYSSFHGTLTITSSTLSGNSARSQGGGIDSSTATVEVNDCTISYNTASNGGGIYNDFENMLTLSNSTLVGNSASDSGGGIHNYFHSTVKVTNSTFVGNSAANYGGGIYNNRVGTTLTVTNSTLSHNSAHEFGGGIANERGGTAVLNNTIVANSIFGGDLYLDAGLGSTYGGNNNLIGDGTNIGSFSSSIQGNPLLSPLASNGGTTQTMALLLGSPAIDTGDDIVLGPPLNLASDQRGALFLRKIGDHVDIGAYEVQPALTPTVTLIATNAVYTGLAYDVANLTATISPISASGLITYDFYSDVGGLNAIAAPINAGTYYVRASFTPSDSASFTAATSDIASFTVTHKYLSVDAATQQTVNIAKDGTITFAIQITAGLVASNNNVTNLFNGAVFTITVGGTSYSVTSTATVAPNGTINFSIKLSQGLQNALLTALSNGDIVTFGLSAISNDGNYCIDGDSISRLINQGKLKFATI